jgi:spore maturation protein CgeB
MSHTQPERRLKLLYVGMRYDYGIPARGLSFEHCNFFDVLTHMGFDILYFDFLDLQRRHGQVRMNEKLWQTVQDEKPDILFSVLYKNELHKDVMRRISEETETVTVNWFCDDHWRFEKFSSRWAHSFNWIATTAHDAVQKYRRLGCKNVLHVQWACNPFMYQKLPLPLVHDATFVGQPHGNRRQMVQAISDAGIDVQAWGNGWDAGRLSQEEMIRVFNQSKVNLNFTDASAVRTGIFQRKKPTQIKGRNFEVPACGGFLLTGPADHLRECYEYGKEIVIAESLSAYIEKTEYYLSHEDERAAIAQAGYERTMRDHTYVHRFSTLFSAMGFEVPTVADVLADRISSGTVRDITITSSEPFVSVVMPVYNGAQFVSAAIDSILAQTFTDFEFLIVDDGSTDNTAEILKTYAAADSRIRILHQANAGKVAARNAGSKAAKGEYIAVMDSDDIDHPDRLTKEVVYLEEHPMVGVVGSWAQLIDAQGQNLHVLKHPLTPAMVAWSLLFKNPVSNASALFRRDLGEKIGWYHDTAAEDYDFWVRLSAITDFATIGTALLQHRLWSGAYTDTHTSAQEHSAAAISQLAAEQIQYQGSSESLAYSRLLIAESGPLDRATAVRMAVYLRGLHRAFVRSRQLSFVDQLHVRQSLAEWTGYIASRVRKTSLFVSLYLLFRSFWIYLPAAKKLLKR